MVRSAESVLASSLRKIGDGHGSEPDVYFICHTLADQCEAHEQLLAPIVDRYGEQPDDEPERLHAAELDDTRSGPLGLLRDLQDLHLLTTFVDFTYTLVEQAAAALRDDELLDVVADCVGETSTQADWLRTRAKQAAPQALIAAE
nr:hypothetical protein [Brevibacterium renqingii]